MQALDDWLTHIAGQHWQSIDMGLERMQAMVARMHLSRPAPQVITIAGTNGKGSTCIACETLLQAQGIRTGVTISPHVTRFNERIRIDGREADDELIVQAFTAVEAARTPSAEPLALTYFEFSALAALWCFKTAGVDAAVLEIGLGGRLDAFNVVDADVAVITSIGLDHEAFLGNDLETIGAEKAGILRRGQRVILGPAMPQSVIARCAELDLQPLRFEALFELDTAEKTSWSVRLADGRALGGVPYGRCAPQNHLAVEGLVPLRLSSLVAASSNCRLPGRMEEVRWQERIWLLDVAHNPAGAEFLLAQLRARGIEPAAIVCGMLADKQHGAVFNVLHRAFDVPWICVSTATERGMQAHQLVDAFAAAAAPAAACSMIACGDWQAVAAQVNSATQPGSVILAFGSFNLIEQFHQTCEASPS